MQDVTDLPFLRLQARYGGADLYCTEYFRVHPDSRLDPKILSSITENPTGRPIVAQMMGNDIPSLIRAAKELEHYPVAAIDLNLGCPVPVVYRKCAGGGLLREPERVDAILGALRQAISIPFTVKTRIGFDDSSVFDQLLPIFARHSLDLLTVHARTVKELYRSVVHYEFVSRAVATMPCPVVANGNVWTVDDAKHVLEITGAAGLMIGRAAIRNPWIFQQIRQHRRGEPIYQPSGRELLDFIHALYEAVCDPQVRESSQVQKMKKYLNYITDGIEPTGQFQHHVRRVDTKADFFRTCAEYLDHSAPFPHERLAMAAN
jgi:nifR3 family TIM-barrel protein